MRKNAGVTLIEVLIAVTLLSLLSVAMLFAIRIGLNTYQKAETKLMDNRRVAGAQRILQQEVEGMVPLVSGCSGIPGGEMLKLAFFQGEQQSMRFVSTFSLHQGWRGQPQILEFTVIPGEEGHGVRLVVNELLYTGRLSAGKLCTGVEVDPTTGKNAAKFGPVTVGPGSFVLADKLEYCRFSYLCPPPLPDPNAVPQWKSKWAAGEWPRGVRIEMAPYEADPGRVQPIAATIPLLLHLHPEIQYVDQ